VERSFPGKDPKTGRSDLLAVAPSSAQILVSGQPAEIISCRTHNEGFSKIEPKHDLSRRRAYVVNAAGVDVGDVSAN